MKFLITGANSFIGLELMHLLHKLGHEVVAVCRPNPKALSQIPSFAEKVLAQMTEYGTLSEKTNNVDVFINLAWAGTGHEGRNVIDVQKENVACAKSAMLEAAKMGCKLFVEAGSQAEYGSTIDPQKEENTCNPFSEYGKAKLQVKDIGFDLSERLGIKYIHLRIFSMFGENDHSWTLVMSVIRKLLCNEQVDLSPCTQNWNFVYVKDAVRIIMSLCVNAVNDAAFKHEIYNIASGDTRQLMDFVEEMKVFTESKSILNYGAVTPQNLVSLQPDMSKTLKVSGFNDFHDFGEVITIIINNFKKGIYD